MSFRSGYQRKRFDLGEAIIQIFKLPGGIGFLVRVLLSATVLIIALYAAFAKPMIAEVVEFAKAMSAIEDGAGDPGWWSIVQSMGVFLGLVFLISLVSWAILASAEAAVHKNKLHNIDHGIFPLRFGRVELRVMLAQLVVCTIIMATIFIGYGLLFGLMALTSDNVAFAAILGLVGFVGFVGMFILGLFLTVRLSPTAALSVADGQIKTLQGWSVTHGRFWPMFGSIVIIYIVGYIAINVVMVGGMMALMPIFEEMSHMPQLDETDTDQVFTILGDIFLKPSILLPTIIVFGMYLIIQFLNYAAYWGVSGYAVGLDQDDPSEVFD